MSMRLSRSIVGKEEARAVEKVICEDGYLGMGAATRKFESGIAEYLGVEPWQTVAVNSGTAALHLACQCVRENPLKTLPSAAIPEIIAPSLTFVASFQAISAASCQPVACDVLPETGTLDLKSAERKLTENTVALMHVDYASNPWQIDRVYEFAARHELRMIDDAAHAFGCRHHGKKIGSFGDIVCFSFDGIKNITCGEGGMLVCFDRESARLAQDARLLGVKGDTEKRYAGSRSWDFDVDSQGWRYHMSNIMAAIGSVQLGRLENEFIPKRQALYEIYRENLGGLPNLRLFKTDPDDFIVPHIMPVRILNNLRDKALEALAAHDIPTGMHYKPNHLLTKFGDGGSLPNAEQLYRELVTLPLHPGLTEADISTICAVLKTSLAC